MATKEILYMEGDTDHAEIFERDLARYGKVKVVPTEHEFRIEIDRLAALGRLPLDLAVLEERIRWTDPSQDIPKRPTEIPGEGRDDAGVRCWGYLRAAERKASLGMRDMMTPVIFLYDGDPSHIFSAMEKRTYSDVDPRYECVLKGPDPSGLRAAVRKALRMGN